MPEDSQNLENRPHSPLKVKTLEHLQPNAAGIKPTDLVESESGKKFVVKAQLSPKHEEMFGLNKFVRGEFDTLRKYGVNVVNFDTIMLDTGSEEYPNPSLGLVADYVEGSKNMFDAPDEEVASTINGLIGYYKHKYFSEEDFLGDITHSSQFVFGSVEGGPKKIYLVDIDFDQNSRLYPYFAEQRTQRILRAFDNPYWREVGILSLIENGGEKVRSLTQENLKSFIDTVNPASLSESLARIYQNIKHFATQTQPPK